MYPTLYSELRAAAAAKIYVEFTFQFANDFADFLDFASL